MAATREQLIARWDTTEGLQLAEEIYQALNPLRGSGKLMIASGEPIRLEESLKLRLARLPFADEVAPHQDLRGVHTMKRHLSLIQVDLTGVRLDYAYELANISDCRLDGAVLDGCRNINGNFRGDFSQVSFIGATLNGCWFRQTKLRGVHFQGARLVRANLREAICADANFLGADLRFSDCLRADFRGADLREADFTEAYLANILFNEQTRLQGANLRGANMKEEFRAFAQQSGALLGESANALTLAELDVTIKSLQEDQDMRLAIALPFVIAVRDKLASDPENTDYDWSGELAEALTRAGHSELVDEVLETWAEIGKALGYYI